MNPFALKRERNPLLHKKLRDDYRLLDGPPEGSKVKESERIKEDLTHLGVSRSESFFPSSADYLQSFSFTFQIFFNKADRTKAKIKMSYTEKGELYCPGISADMPPIDEEKWIQLGKKTIEDLNDNNIFINKWNDAVRIGQITPTVKNLLSTIFNLDKKLR